MLPQFLFPNTDASNKSTNRKIEKAPTKSIFDKFPYLDLRDLQFLECLVWRGIHQGKVSR